MVKFKNCVLVVVFFALISFLAFFPAGSKPGHAEKSISRDSVTAPSPIPQKAEGGTMQETPKKLHNPHP
jgi:hypothetical protein